MTQLGQVEVSELEAVLLKRRAASLLRQKLELIRDNGIAFYTPWWKQDLYHRNAHKRYRFFRAGNRTGKSVANCAEVIALALGRRPWYERPFDVLASDGSVYRHHDGHPNHPLVTHGLPQRPTKVCVVQVNWDKVKEVWTGNEGQMVGKIWQMAPKGAILKHIKNHAGVIDTLVWANGSITKFDTVQAFEHDEQRAESSDWDAIVFDEPVPEEMRKALARGLIDRGGSELYGLTSLKHRWINNFFFPAPGQRSDVIPENRWAITADMNENPYLNADARADYISTLTEEERDCRVRGLPLELTGLVYKEFDYGKHVLDPGPPKGWKDWSTPPLSHVISYSIDTHPRTPQTVLFVATNEHNQHFIYDEIFPPCTADVLVEEIKHRIDPYRERLTKCRKCEPAAWVEDQSTEFCLGEYLIQNGIWVERASKSKSFGILQMRRLLAKTNVIFVNPNLRRFHFEINNYCYDKDDKPIDKDDHMMEAMYRLFINEPEWFPAPEDNENEGPIGDIIIPGADYSRTY